MKRFDPGIPPSQRRGKNDPAIYIAEATTEEPIILGDATVEHLQGSIYQIRATYWDGVVNCGFVDPFVFVIHNRSAFAKSNGVADGPILQYQSVTREGAAMMGLLTEEQARGAMRPPVYEILLATGDRIERHTAMNMTPSGVLDQLHFQPDRKAEILAEHKPDLAEMIRERPELIAKPWLLNGSVGFRVK